jgi:hypothetical protein
MLFVFELLLNQKPDKKGVYVEITGVSPFG